MDACIFVQLDLIAGKYPWYSTLLFHSLVARYLDTPELHATVDWSMLSRHQHGTVPPNDGKIFSTIKYPSYIEPGR